MSVRPLQVLEKDMNSQQAAPFASLAFGQGAVHLSGDQTSISLSREVLETADLRLHHLLIGLKQAIHPVQEQVIGVWLHGSLATADFTPYSDVDALFVVRDEVLQDEVAYRRVKTAVLAALRHVFLFDPLQHHGFFVATPHILAFWPAAYLPAAALSHARLLEPISEPISLHEYRNATEGKLLLQNLVQQMCRATPPPNLYKAKGLLSQFMLLPAAYCQAMGNSVYKRESFGLVQEQFQTHWQPMEEASRMRQEWKTPKRPFWALILSLTNPWLASRLYRPIERRLPVCHHYPNWMQFIQAMQKLAQAMEQKIV